jgi:hypothetical protein
MACSSYRRGFIVFLAANLLALPATAAKMQCAGPSLSLTVDVDPVAGTCAVDGARAALRKAHNPVVCHLSNPQLRILTIGTDGGFTWEDTSDAMIVQGTCRAS